MKVGNFRISVQEPNLTIDYERSLKDWIDILIVVGFGTIAGIGAFFITQVLIDDFQVILFLIDIIFIYGAVIKLIDGLSRGFQTTHAVIKIDSKQLQIKYFPWKTVSLPINQIDTMKLKGQIENLNVPQRRVSCEILAVTKDNKTKTVCIINPKQFLRISDRKMDIDLYRIGRTLTKVIADKIGAKYQWTGFNKD